MLLQGSELLAPPASLSAGCQDAGGVPCSLLWTSDSLSPPLDGQKTGWFGEKNGFDLGLHPPLVSCVISDKPQYLSSSENGLTVSTLWYFSEVPGAKANLYCVMCQAWAGPRGPKSVDADRVPVLLELMGWGRDP